MKRAHTKSIDELYKELNTSENGLSKEKVNKRLLQNGKNVCIM